MFMTTWKSEHLLKLLPKDLESKYFCLTGLWGVNRTGNLITILKRPIIFFLIYFLKNQYFLCSPLYSALCPNLMGYQSVVVLTEKKSLDHFFFFGYTLQHVELPWAGIKPVSPALEVWSLNHWTTREVMGCLFQFHIQSLLWNTINNLTKKKKN